MKGYTKLSKDIKDLLRCPICKKELKLFDGQFQCINIGCQQHFPIIKGIPILINEDRSIFSIDDFISMKDTFFNSSINKIEKILKQIIPDISKNIKGRYNYDRFIKLLTNMSINPKVLVIGSGILGKGMDTVLSCYSIELVESDISFGPRTTLICDAHDIPFENNSFDGIIIQAVLEHVVDPYRCVEEIYRVLKKCGFIYSEVPFMQQVHGGRYDFFRFTYLGQRRLFRKFEEIDGGIVCGPGMALAWAYQYFLLSFTSSKFFRRLIYGFARMTSFYLKYFDYYLIKKTSAFDAASGYYFLGKKSDRILSDKELIKLYKGSNDRD